MAEAGVEGLVTFLYYKDLSGAVGFYEEIMGFELTVDQGWAKIYRVLDGAFVGLVDERRGYHRVSPMKPVMITIVVPDVDAWYLSFKEKGVDTLNEPRDIDEVGIRAFLLKDPEGYVIEVMEFI